MKETAVDIYEKKSRDLIHMYVNGDIDVRELLTSHHNIYYDIKQMEKEQHNFTFEVGRMFQISAETTFDEYFDETYGSNGSDEHIVDTNEMIDHVPDVRKLVSSQTEISDEEIDKQADYEFRHFEDEDKDTWIRACRWYREQLKQRQ